MGTATLNKTDFKVADLALADWGRKEISIAEHEMPGRMAIRPGISCSAMEISFRPQSASARSATLKSVLFNVAVPILTPLVSSNLDTLILVYSPDAVNPQIPAAGERP